MFNHLRHAHALLFPIQDRPANWARCPFKVFQYAQARRPVITCSVGEVPQTLGNKATYIPCTAEAFADAIAQAVDQPTLPDVDYGVEQQNWDDRFARLLAALQNE